jgi:nucleotide-binding universal stress UspA family protein
MKKILAAFDGLKYSQATCDYALYLSRLTRAHLVGVFLDDRTYTGFKIYEAIGKEGVSERRLQELQNVDKERRAKAAVQFRESCARASVDFTLHHDRNVAIHELKHESIYTDLLIIDSRETLTHYTEKLPTRFVRELLIDTQSPVLLVPGKFKTPDRIVLLYDGEPSAVFAIKMFSYLLPQLKSLPVEVVSVNPVNRSLHLTDNKLMKEFMKRHYPDASFTVLKGLPEEEILRHLESMKGNPLLVLGAYRRGAVSRLFRESMADTLMKNLKLPLFVAHSK